MRRRDLNHLDEEIAKVQRSTGTLFGFMIPIHNSMRLRFNWYYRWHTTPWAKPLHWLILLFYITSIGVSFSSLYNPTSFKPTKAEVTYDYPRWDYLNPYPAGEYFDSVQSDGTNYWLTSDKNIYKYDGTHWIKQVLPDFSWNNSGNLTIISPSLIYASTLNTLYKYNGLAWSKVDITFPSGFLYPSKIYNENNFWAEFGAPGPVTKVAHYDGNNWNEFNFPDLDFSIDYLDNTQIAWAAGPNGKIYKTLDAGLNWISQTTNTNEDLNKIKIIDNSTAYVFGANGIILKTTNGGSSWTEQTSNTTEGLNNAWVFDSEHLWVIGNNGVIRYTLNGGTNWATQTSNTSLNLQTIKGVDINNLWIQGRHSQDSTQNVILKTTNAGTDWASQDIDQQFNIGVISFIDLNKIWFVGSGIYFSANNGDSWTNYYRNTFTDKITSIFRLDDANTWVASTNTNGYSGIFKFNGTAWQQQYTNIFINFTNVRFIKALTSTNAWAVSSEGIIHYNGTNWSLSYSAANQMSSDLYVQDASNIWAAKKDGTVLKYDGNTWNIQTAAPGAPFPTGAQIRIKSPTSMFAVTSTKIFNYNGSDWVEVYNIAGTPIAYGVVTVLDQNNIWVIDNLLPSNVYRFNGTSWGTAEELPNAESYLSDIAVISSNDIRVIGGNPINKTAYIAKFDGNVWSDISSDSQIDDFLTFIQANDANNISIGGYSGQAMFYHAPANAIATKLLVVAPGQTWSDGNAISGTPITQTAGIPFNVKIYAVRDDGNGKYTLDRGNASFVSVNGSDPQLSGGGIVQLTDYDLCSQETPVLEHPCGVGTISVTFKTASGSGWQVGATDNSNILSSSNSANIPVVAGQPSSINLGMESSTGIAGQPLKGSITLKDAYGNITNAITAITIRLSSNSTGASFSNSAVGPFAESSVSLNVGESTKDFWYLDSHIGSPTIYASSDGFSDVNNIISIINGAISPTNSSFVLSSSSTSVSDIDNLNFIITLKDANNIPVSGKQIAVSSNRGDESISFVASTTNIDGQAFGVLYSKKSGKATLSAIDTTDNIYIYQKPDITFNALGPTTFNATVSSETVIAGNIFSLNLVWQDKFSNYASLTNGKINLEISDASAEIAQKPNYSVAKILNILTYKAYAKSLTSTYSAGNAGFKKIDLKLTKSGDQTIKINDVNNGFDAEKKILVLPASYSDSKSNFSIVTPKMAVNSQTTATVKIADDYGNPIPGKVVQLSLTNYPAKLSITPQIGASDFIAISKQYGAGKTLPEISLYNITDNNGIAKYSISSSQELTTDISAKNISDNINVGGVVNLQIVPASFLQTTIDNLRNNEVLQNITENIIKPLAQLGAQVIGASLILQIVSAIPQGFHLTAYGFTLMLQAARLKKKRNPWGRVVDSISGKAIGLAVVRLNDKSSNKLISTVVTDEDGRFEFVAKPGQYFITVSKEKYTFPATFFAKLINNPTVQPYNDRYLGQPFVVTPENPNINLTIPLDPVNPRLSLGIRIRLWLSVTANFAELLIGYSAIPLLVIGIILALFGYIIQPDQKSLYIIIIYAILGIVTIIRTYFKVNRQLIIYDANTGKPLEKVVVAIFDTEFSMLRSNLITNSRGLSSVLLRPGTYEIKVDYSEFQFTPSPKIKSKFAPVVKNLNIVIKKPQFLHIAIPMKKNVDI